MSRADIFNKMSRLIDYVDRTDGPEFVRGAPHDVLQTYEWMLAGAEDANDVLLHPERYSEVEAERAYNRLKTHVRMFRQAMSELPEHRFEGYESD